MKRTTRKLSGHTKDRFLERFFAAEDGLAKELAERLAARSKATFTSVRIRRGALSQPGRLRSRMKVKPAGDATGVREPDASDHAAQTSAPDVKPETRAPFDPYSIGLVPVFQREGRDGLIGRLTAVSTAGHLRQLAKAQQIVLPQDMRSGDVDLSELRAAIADAVARRIADRRAAAG
ncbi:MAG: hypothetical protein AB7O43_01665 [Hyphomicrobiaceae bacterium]